MGKHRWRCDKDSGHGYVDFTHALGASCDVFFYEAGARLGADAIAKWANAFGLGVPTGFEIAGEVPGVSPTWPGTTSTSPAATSAACR
jgi:penicillin-binding protein 2